MKIYIIFKNNEETYEDYYEWILEVNENKERAKKRFLELIKTNKSKKDRKEINIEEYLKEQQDYRRLNNIGAYRLEEHELIKESEKK